MRRDSDKYGNFYIHASSLNTFTDCEMRWAAQNVNRIGKICEDEHKRKQEGGNRLIGALFGTAAHLGTQLMLEEKMASGDWDFPRAYKLASERLEEDCESAGSNLAWDAVTKRFDVASEQLKKVLKEVDLHKEPHGLSFEERDALARARGLLTLGSLPNQDGYQFHGVAIDGWVFNCHIHKGQDGIHRAKPLSISLSAGNRRKLRGFDRGVTL